MHALPELQRGFACDILSDAANATGNSICTGKFSSERLLQIYRNNYFLSLTQALKDTHPVVNKLVGDGFFNYAANHYIRQYPSVSGNLHNFGNRFGNFLKTFDPAADLPYLVDIAKLDWACHLAFHATDTLFIDQQKLAQIPTEQYAGLRFSIAASVTLLQSEHPVFSIWQFSNRENNTDETRVNPNASGECVLIHRPVLEVAVAPISAAEFAFLHSLADEQSLGFAIEQAVDENNEFDLNAVLSHFLGHGVLTDIHFN